MTLLAGALLRPIAPADDAAMAAVIRAVMPEFGACGDGFAINDPEVDWMSRAYAEPRHAYFVLERDGRVLGRHRSTGIGRPRFWDRARYYGLERELAEALDAAE